MGLAGSSFAIGVGYVSRWTPAERQGGALGVYGLGNIGQSAAVFLGPVIAARVGMATVFHGVAIMLVVWAVAFGLLARNAPAPATAQRKGLGVMIEVLTREKLAWLLAAFYFLTFGGFVAFSIYLPTLLKDEFHLAPADAGFRTAGFVVLATLLRPLGGWLSDRIGGARVLSAVFLGVAPFAILMAWSSMIPFTVGALGCAALLGLGNGAVFKLVPQYFPTQTGTVTGLVGAMGGLGGFFPPLLLAFFRSRTGAIWPGFALLAIAAWVLWWANHKVFVPRQQALDIALPADLRRTADRVRAGAWATLWTALLVAAIVVGSAESAELRPGAGDLHFRRGFRDLGRGLPLQRLAGETADPSVLGSWLGTLPAQRRCPQPVSCQLRLQPLTWPANVSSLTAPGCAGGCTSASFGDACWQSPSPFRWSSAGFTSARFPATN